jgi:CheY-like chemotaxis protein
MGADSGRPSRSGSGVLIAESDLALADLYRSTLQAAGWQVDVVSDSESVVERVHRAPPAVLLLSSMRDADQISVAERVRSIPEADGLVIIVLFDSFDHLDRKVLARTQVQAWLSKTRTTREQLSETIAKLVGQAP